MQPAAPWPQWPFDIACYTLLAIGVPLLIWAWWWDRPRHRHRCPKCWYNLAGLAIPADRTQPPVKCPECGREVRTVRETTLTRRRRWWAGLAVVMVLASSVVKHLPDARKHGWRDLAPTTPLLVAAWLGYVTPDDARSSEPTFAGTLLGRALSAGTWTWQRRAGLSMLAPALVKIRARNLAGYEIPFEHYAKYVVPNFYYVRRAKPKSNLPSHEQRWRDAVPRGPAQPLGPFSWSFIVQCRDGFSHTVSVGSETIDNIDACMTPLRGESIDQRVRRSLEPRLIVQSDSLAVAPVFSDASIGRCARLGVTVPLRILAQQDGQTRAKASWLLRTTDMSTFSQSWIDPALLEGTPDDVAALRAAIDTGDATERARWSFAFTTDRQLALSDLYSNAYWAGSFTMTLDELLAPRSVQAPASTSSNQNTNK